MNQLDLQKKELLDLLSKIGITTLNQSDQFMAQRPDVYFPDGRTIFLENGVYHVIGVDRGIISLEKTFNNKEDFMYYLLESYVSTVASKNAWEKANSDMTLYAKLLPEEPIKVFSIIDVAYGESRKKDIEGETF